MQKKQINAVFFTGPAGNGKSTLITLMHEAMKSGPVCHRVRRMDMSRIITSWGMNQNSDLGRRLREYKEVIERGEYVPDSVAIETFREWLDIVTKQNGPELFLLAGVPRTVPQLVLCDLFEKYAIVHIDATRDQSDQAIMERINKGEIRLDSDTSEGFRERRWREYVTKTKPILDRHDRIILESRSTPLKEKISNILICLRHISGLEEHLERAQESLRKLDHSVAQMIWKIENPQTAQ